MHEESMIQQDIYIYTFKTVTCKGDNAFFNQIAGSPINKMDRIPRRIPKATDQQI